MSLQGRESARALVWLIKRSGFTQLRGTHDGFLYGSGTHRFLLPHAVARGAATESMIEELTERFRLAVAKRDADMGRPRPQDDQIQPVLNPEDLLHDDDEGGPPVADTGVVSPAGAGPTPAPPATPTEPDADAGREPGIATPALEGSTPSVGTIPPPEEVPMAKVQYDRRGRRIQAPWTCPKCGRELGRKGRHEEYCDGKPAKAAPEAPTPRRTRGAPVTITASIVATNGHFEEQVHTFIKASTDIVELLRAAHTEAMTYKRERDDLAKRWEAIEALFQRPQVPRG